MKQYKLSPSALSLLKDCPKCFWLHHNQKIRRPATIFPSLPSGMDRILKNHFDSFRKRGLLPPELKVEKDIKLFEDMELLTEWRKNLRGIQWHDEKGNLLRGAVDEILDKKGKLIVLDYKTRGFPLKEDTHKYYTDQINFYNFLLRKNGFKTEDHGYLLFYHPNKVHENGDMDFHVDLIKMKVNVENAGKIFKNAIEVLEGPLPKAHEECGF